VDILMDSIIVRLFRTISAHFNIWTLIDIIDFVVTVHFSGDPFMTFSAVWRHLFHDVILATLWRFLPFSSYGKIGPFSSFAYVTIYKKKMASMHLSISLAIIQKFAIFKIIEFLVNLRCAKIYPDTVFSSIPKFQLILI
jgi:hypothetical protein